MIARWLVPALALALPLVAPAQETAPRARWSQQRAEDDGPRVRLWLPGGGSFRYGQPVQVMFEVSEDAHAVVLRVDGNGRLSVLWPQSRNLQTAARAGREYRITGPYSSISAFNADYEFANGMVIAIASPDPIDLSTFRRYRNDHTYYQHANLQRPYFGSVRHVLERITHEVLYDPDTPYDYDVAFYNVAGRSFFSNASYANCRYDYITSHARYNRSYLSWPYGSLVSDWDDCSGSSFYRNYWIYCASWSAVNSGYGSSWCNFWNPNWPVPPITGAPQPQAPTPNIAMIDSIMARPVDRHPPLDGKAEPTTPNGQTVTVYMEPVRETPGGTRWIPENENDAISIPRLRRGTNEGRDPSRGGDRINTRDEGFTRSPGTNIRTSDPRAGDQPPDRSGGTVFMPPVRQAPRPEPVWRDNGGPDRVGPAQRWERPVSAEPRSPGSSSGSSHSDRGSTSSGTTASPSGAGAAVTPKTEPPSKAPDAKATGERKPQ